MSGGLPTLFFPGLSATDLDTDVLALDRQNADGKPTRHTVTRPLDTPEPKLGRED